MDNTRKVVPISDSVLTRPATQRQMKAQLRDVFREAFDRLGGADWLVDFAERDDANARVFVSAVTKLIPLSAKLDVSLTDDTNLELISTAQLKQMFLQLATSHAEVVQFEEITPEPEQDE
jgi:hypothetical protein